MLASTTMTPTVRSGLPKTRWIFTMSSTMPPVWALRALCWRRHAWLGTTWTAPWRRLRTLARCSSRQMTSLARNRPSKSWRPSRRRWPRSRARAMGAAVAVHLVAAWTIPSPPEEEGAKAVDVAAAADTVATRRCSPWMGPHLEEGRLGGALQVEAARRRAQAEEEAALRPRQVLCSGRCRCPNQGGTSLPGRGLAGVARSSAPTAWIEASLRHAAQ
mmetsp:Transcript_80831/g.172860  ORF Transcript_80831/g.172860 Transcript_80831/m.172860 type:complete len:217 (+) Transcript_80831:2822-3472(+)